MLLGIINFITFILHVDMSIFKYFIKLQGLADYGLENIKRPFQKKKKYIYIYIYQETFFF